MSMIQFAARHSWRFLPVATREAQPLTHRQRAIQKPFPFSALGLLTALLILCSIAGQAGATDRTYKRTIESYTIPDVTLVNQNGAKVRLKKLLQSDRLVALDFIFGTCTTICPVLSAGYATLQYKLGPDSQKVHLVSISIDPENDTPKVMKDYLSKFQAKPGWDFLTGSRADIDKVMYAFSAYVPNKMSHYPLTLIRAPGGDKWVRIYGIMGSAEFVSECQKAGLK